MNRRKSLTLFWILVILTLLMISVGLFILLRASFFMHHYHISLMELMHAHFIALSLFVFSGFTVLSLVFVLMVMPNKQSVSKENNGGNKA